jgi:hypothetical protein
VLRVTYIAFGNPEFTFAGSLQVVCGLINTVIIKSLQYPANGPTTKTNSGTSADLSPNFAGYLRVPRTTNPRSRLKPPHALLCSRPPVLAPSWIPLQIDVETGEESTGRPFRSRKPKWTNELDALLLREVKLHKPHQQRHG